MYMVNQYRLWNNYKSHGERKIAEYLEGRKFDFSYEKPIAVLDNGKTKIWYPDFYLNEFHILVEYFGMNGHPHNDRLNEHKIAVYKANNYDLIEIYPNDFRKNWQEAIDEKVYETLDNRVRSYVSKIQDDPTRSEFGTFYEQNCFKFY